MNKLIKSILIFALGAVGGGIPAYFYGKKKGWSDGRKEGDDMVLHIRKYYEETYEPAHKPSERKEKAEDITGNAPSPTIYKTTTKEESFIRRETSASDPGKDYTKFFRESECPEDEGDTGAYETAEHENNKRRPPKIIKAADYGSDPTFDTMDLLYYQSNDVLTLDEDEIEETVLVLDEVRSMIGDALEKFGFKSSDEEVIYVRNFQRDTDYCITKVFGPYVPND